MTPIHRFFTALSAISLLLFFVAIGLRLRDRSYAQRLTYTGSNYLYALDLGNSVWFISRTSTWEIQDHWFTETKLGPPDLNSVEPELAHSFAGFGYEHSVEGSLPVIRDEITLPSWSTIAFPAILPTLWILHKSRMSPRNKAGHCRHCGYDLRATPEQCPECGTIPKHGKA